MTDEATQAGATKPVKTTQRESAFSDIVENARLAREAAMATGEDDHPEAIADALDNHPDAIENSEDDAPEVTSQEQDEPEQEQEPAAEDDLVTIVVDGEERQVPKSKIYEQGVRTLQKESAADKRLAEAADRVRQADEYAAKTLSQIEARLRAAEQNQNNGVPLSKEQDVDVKTRARKIIASILDGTEEEAADALAEAIQGRSDPTPQFDAGQLVEQTTVNVERRINHANALREFRRNYSDIVEDPQLFNMADRETLKVHQEHPEWEVSDILTEAGTRVRNWVASKVPQVAPSDIERADKLARKSVIDNPKAASARAPQPVEEKPPSRSDVVASMRKARGYST